jgi:hypothetical protein
VEHTTNAVRGAQVADVRCPCCEGRGWSRSASGRCTFCHGDGVLHEVLHYAPVQGKRALHPGVRALCDVPACRRPSVTLSVEGGR